MEIGEHKGKKVQEIKKSLQKQLLDKNEAVLYHEPDKQIISRWLNLILLDVKFHLNFFQNVQ